MKKIILTLMFGLFLINLAGIDAGLIGPFEKGIDINLPQTCDDCTYNNITSILYPNSSIAISNVQMTQDGTFFNYTLDSNYTNDLGTYLVNGVGDLNGVDTIWFYDFVVTTTGKEVTTGNAIISFLATLLFFILGSIFLILTFKENIKLPVKFTLIIVSFLAFLAGLNLISAIIPDALINERVVSFFDSFTAISFILFWFAFGLIAVMWFLTFLQTWFLNQNLKNMKKYGLA